MISDLCVVCFVLILLFHLHEASGKRSFGPSFPAFLSLLALFWDGQCLEGNLTILFMVCCSD